MVDPDAPDLAAAVPIRCIQENERVSLSIDAEFEHPLGGRELSTEAEVQALVVSGNYAGRGHVLSLDHHDPAQRIVGERRPRDALESARRHPGPIPGDGAARIRLPATAATPCIGLSASSEAGTRVGLRASAAGADGTCVSWSDGR